MYEIGLGLFEIGWFMIVLLRDNMLLNTKFNFFYSYRISILDAENINPYKFLGTIVTIFKTNLRQITLPKQIIDKISKY